MSTDPAPDVDPPAPPDGDPPAPPAGAPPAPRPRIDVDAVGALLAQHFPALFGGPPRPIKLHVHADIAQRAPGVFTRRALSAFLHRHTSSTAYLQALAQSGERFDLDGQPAGELSAEHRDAAAQELARRRALRDQRRPQRGASPAEARPRDLAEQQRRNRARLLRDFETSTLTRANFCTLKGVPPDELDGLLEMARHERSLSVPQRGRG